MEEIGTATASSACHRAIGERGTRRRHRRRTALAQLALIAAAADYYYFSDLPLLPDQSPPRPVANEASEAPSELAAAPALLPSDAARPPAAFPSPTARPPSLPPSNAGPRVSSPTLVAPPRQAARPIPERPATAPRGNADGGRLAALPPASAPARQPVTRVDLIGRYIEQYDGGECFFIAPVAISDTSAIIEGLGASLQPFNDLDEAFKRDIGFEADIGIRQVTSAQCPAVTFLGRFGSALASAPRLEIDKTSFRNGEIVSGFVERIESRNVELLLVSADGIVQNVSNLLEPGVGARRFRLPLQQPDAPTGSQPQLVIAVTSAAPRDVMRPQSPIAAEAYFAAAVTEATRLGDTLAATAQYFRLEPPLDGAGPSQTAPAARLPQPAGGREAHLEGGIASPRPAPRPAGTPGLGPATFASRLGAAPWAMASTHTPPSAAGRPAVSALPRLLPQPHDSAGLPVASAPGAPSADRIDAGRLAALPPASLPPRQQVTRVELIRRYVEQYDGGECFFVAPVAISDTSAAIEGLGVSTQAFNGLDEAFKREIGFEAEIGIRQVTQAQCPAVSFLARLGGARAGAPRLEIETTSLHSGEILAGSIARIERRHIELLLVTGSGTVRNISDLLEPGVEPGTFRLPVQQPDGLPGSQPQLLLVVASAAPLAAMRAPASVEAESFFAAVVAEAARSGESLSATAKYFRADPALDGGGPTQVARAASLLSVPTRTLPLGADVAKITPLPLPRLEPPVPSSDRVERPQFANPAAVASARVVARLLPPAAAARSTPPFPLGLTPLPPSTGRSGLAQPAPARRASAAPSLAVPPPMAAAAGTTSGGRLATLPTAPVQPVTRADLISRYVEQYDGGECFFIAPVAIRDMSAAIEGFGPSLQPFNALDEAFKRDNGFEADIGIRQVTPAQCPAVSFLGRVRGARAGAPRLELSKTNLHGGEMLSGVIDRFGSRTLELLLVSETGSVQNISEVLEPDAGRRTFSFPVPRRDDGAGSRPQLLLAVATVGPLRSLRPDGPIDAQSFFAAVLAEGARSGQSLATTASYFRLEPPLDGTGPVQVATASSLPALVDGRPAIPRAAMAAAREGAESPPGLAKAWPPTPHVMAVPGLGTGMTPSGLSDSVISVRVPTGLPRLSSEASPLPPPSPSILTPRSSRRITIDEPLSAERYDPDSAARAAAAPFSNAAPTVGHYPAAAPRMPGTAAAMPPVARVPAAAKADPGQLAALAPPRRPPMTRTDRIRRYVEQYDGGECFFIAPVTIRDTSAAIEGFGVSLQPFNALDEAFKRDNGFEADIGIRRVTPAQCPAVSFLGRVRDARAGAPRLELSKTSLHGGEMLSGVIDRFGSRTLELLLVSETGSVRNISDLLEPIAATKTFSFPAPRRDDATGSHPQLLLAVATAAPLRSLRPDGPIDVQLFFAAVLAEGARSGQSLATTASYFRLEPPLDGTGPVQVATAASLPAIIDGRPAIPGAAVAASREAIESPPELRGRFEPTVATRPPAASFIAAMAASTPVSGNPRLPSASATISSYLQPSESRMPTPDQGDPSPASRAPAMGSAAKLAAVPVLSEAGSLPPPRPSILAPTSPRRIAIGGSQTAERHDPDSAARPAAAPFSNAAPGVGLYPAAAPPMPGMAAAMSPAAGVPATAKADPGQLAALAPPPRRPRMTRTELIRRYVEQYDGGDCFFIAPVAISDKAAVIEGLGVSMQPFDKLDDAFKRDNGFEADIGIRQVTNAQCAAVTFLARLRDARADAPRLEIDKLNLRSGETLSGSVGRFGSENVELILVSDDGSVQNISRLLRPGPDSRTFSIAIEQQDGVNGSQPELLLAVASAAPLRALRPDRPMTADAFFPAVLAEAARSGQSLAASARYFRLEH
jgi:hypothetical protein